MPNQWPHSFPPNVLYKVLRGTAVLMSSSFELQVPTAPLSRLPVQIPEGLTGPAYGGCVLGPASQHYPAFLAEGKGREGSGAGAGQSAFELG